MMILCTFQAEPTQSPQVGLVHTLIALNPGVMWEPVSRRSGWFGRPRPLVGVSDAHRLMWRDSKVRLVKGRGRPNQPEQ